MNDVWLRFVKSFFSTRWDSKSSLGRPSEVLKFWKPILPSSIVLDFCGTLWRTKLHDSESLVLANYPGVVSKS